MDGKHQVVDSSTRHGGVLRAGSPGQGRDQQVLRHRNVGHAVLLPEGTSCGQGGTTKVTDGEVTWTLPNSLNGSTRLD